MSEILVNSLKTAGGVGSLTFDSTGDVLLTSGRLGRVAGNTITIDSDGILSVPAINITSGTLDSSSIPPISASMLVGQSAATGGGTDQVFWVNDKNITADYTLLSTKNAMTAGPINIDSGITVTIDSGAEWTIV